MNKKTIYYINGKWILSNQANIPFNDAGFLYGDGLFETMRFDNKVIFSLEKHLNRLNQGLKVVDLSMPCDNIKLHNILKSIIDKNNISTIF